MTADLASYTDIREAINSPDPVVFYHCGKLVYDEVPCGVTTERAWPTTRPGADHLAVDTMPTLLELAGVNIPDERMVILLQGVASLVPV